MDKRKKSLKITKDIRNIKNNKQEEKIIVTYNNKEYEFDGEESILDTFKSIIEKEDKYVLYKMWSRAGRRCEKMSIV